MHTIGINDIPESLLLLMFQQLEVKDIVSCSSVCSRWNRISQDQLLWRKLFVNDFTKKKSHSAGDNNSLVLAANAESWRNEYKRLYHNYPCHKHKTLYKSQNDQNKMLCQSEVTYFEFSHDGMELSACTTDNLLLRWRKDNAGSLKFLEEVDIGNNYNLEVSNIHYSPTKAKMLVTGFNYIYENTETMVFSTADISLIFLGKLSFQSTIMTARWLTDEFFIVAEDNKTERDFYRSSDDSTVYSLTSCRSWKESSRVAPLGNTKKINTFLKYLGAYYRECMNGNELVVYFKRPNLQTDKVDELQEDQAQSTSDILRSTEDSTKETNALFVQSSQPWAVFAFGKTDKFAHKLGFHHLTSERLKKDIVSAKPDYELDMKGEIAGMSVSPDQDILYVHVYGIFDAKTQELRLKQNSVKTDEDYHVIKKINLRSLQEISTLSYYKDMSEVYKASLLLPPLFPHYLGESKNYLAVNAEDYNVYVWDRNYGVLLTKIQFDKNESWCVHFAAFDPNNEEILLVANTRGLSIWHSNNLSKNIKCQKNENETWV